MEKEPKLVSTWEMLYKNSDGDGIIKTLHKYDHTMQEADIKNFLSQAEPAIISDSKPRRRTADSEMVIDIPDIHYGLRRLPDGSLRPTHNPEAMDRALQITKEIQPKLIILGGDIIDAPNLAKFEMDSRHFVDTLQLSINGLYKFLARLRADNPNATIINTFGNHDSRFEKDLMRKSPEMFGIKQADMPDAVNTLNFLCRLQELGIENISGAVKIMEDLYTEHGDMSVTNGSTAHKYMNKYPYSMMFHHTHRREDASKVYPNGKKIEAFSFGCMADISGSVPANGNKINDSGYPVENYMNWNNGMGYVELGKNTFKPTAIPIERENNFDAEYNHRVYKARQDVVEALKNGN